MKYEFSNNQLNLFKGEEKIGGVIFGMGEKNVKTLLHVFIKPSMRGQGVATKLMERVVELAISQNFLILPLCSFAVRFFEKNTQYSHILLKK